MRPILHLLLMPSSWLERILWSQTKHPLPPRAHGLNKDLRLHCVWWDFCGNWTVRVGMRQRWLLAAGWVDGTEQAGCEWAARVSPWLWEVGESQHDAGGSNRPAVQCIGQPPQPGTWELPHYFGPQCKWWFRAKYVLSSQSSYYFISGWICIQIDRN